MIPSMLMAPDLVAADLAEYNCINCKAPCCRLAVRLTTIEIRSGTYLHTLTRESNGDIGAYIPQTKEGNCMYRCVEEGICTIYQRRPLVCRGYTCENDPRIDNTCKYETGKVIGEDIDE